MPRWIVTLLVAAAVAAAAPHAAHAQEAPEGEILGAEECTVAPADLDALADEFRSRGTPAATPASPGATPVASPGTEADAQTVDAVTETVRQFFACTNAGDFRRLFSLFTLDGLAQLGLSAETAGALGFLPEATPSAEENLIGLIEIRDVRQLEDGRATATVVGDGTTTEPTPLTMTLVERDGMYQIDSVAGLVVDATPAA